MIDLAVPQALEDQSLITVQTRSNASGQLNGRHSPNLVVHDPTCADSNVKRTDSRKASRFAVTPPQR